MVRLHYASFALSHMHSFSELISLEQFYANYLMAYTNFNAKWAIFDGKTAKPQNNFKFIRKL